MRLTRSGSLKLVMTATMLFWASIAATPAKADLVNFAFHGIVFEISPSLTGSSLGGNSSAFDEPHTIDFSGSYTFDTSPSVGSVVTSSPGTGSESVYSNKISDFNFTLSRDAISGEPNSAVNYQGSFVPPNPTLPTNTITVGNGVNHLFGLPTGLPVDVYEVVIPVTGGAVNSVWLPTRVELLYGYGDIGNTGPFTTTNLPLAPPGISPFQMPFRVYFSNGSGESQVIGFMTPAPLVATPLPPAVIMFGAGLVSLIGLGAMNWRQRKDGLPAEQQLSGSKFQA
ncbi:MAG: hypothetical protein CAF45_015740 [Nitrospira sp. CG24E]|nr:MAG: hypothetical protein CAF45_015740 [Nitrospira sp. CG24E]